ncbi:MAG: FHA domain-containing protein [Anaerolineales bacterium]
MTSNPEYPLLIAQEGPLNGQRWTINHSLVIGRQPSCDIIIPDRQVSRFHARLTPGLEGVILEDLGSKNGTHHNGQAVKTPIILQDGDLVQIALAQQFLFLTSDSTIPIESSPLRGRLIIDERTRRVWINQKAMEPPLSPQQFRLLWYLYEHQGEIVSRQELILAVWGENALEVSEQALDALIRRVRDRLATFDPTHTYIKTVRGHGVRLDNPSF